MPGTVVGHPSARTPDARALEQDDLGKSVGDSRIPVVERASEMLQKQQWKSGARAELTIGVLVISCRDELRRSGGVACRGRRTDYDRTHNYPPGRTFLNKQRFRNR